MYLHAAPTRTFTKPRSVIQSESPKLASSENWTFGARPEITIGVAHERVDDYRQERYDEFRTDIKTVSRDDLEKVLLNIMT